MIGLKIKTTAHQVTSNKDTSGQDLFICAGTGFLNISCDVMPRGWEYGGARELAGNVVVLCMCVFIKSFKWIVTRFQGDRSNARPQWMQFGLSSCNVN